MITKEFKVSSKNQVTLPKIILKKLSIRPGDPIYFEIKDNRVEVHPVKENKISALELGKDFRHLVKKKAKDKDIIEAIQKGYIELAGKNQ